MLNLFADNYILITLMLVCTVASYLDIIYYHVNLFDSVMLICGLEFYLYVYMEHYKTDLYKLYKKADKKMYLEKEKYHKKHPRSR